MTSCAVPDDKPDLHAPKKEDLVRLCDPAKEYITTTRFLRENRMDMHLRDMDIHRIADEVAKGCEGSAARFVNAFNVLDKLEVGANAAVSVGIKLAQKDETYTDVYLGVLKRSYLAEFLDLDLLTAMKLAEALSVDYLGDVKVALDDYTKLVDFCLKRSDVELSLKDCGGLAGRVAKASEKFATSLADSFIKTFEYLTQTKNIQMKVGEAITLAEQVALIHPNAIDSFIVAHGFALEKEGLDLDARRSLIFARRLATRTRWEPRKKDPLVLPELRMPASTTKVETDSSPEAQD